MIRRMTNPPVINSAYTVHLWEDDLRTTICGLPKEIVVPLTGVAGSIVSSCDNCHHILAGYVWMAPTPAEAALLDYFFPDA